MLKVNANLIDITFDNFVSPMIVFTIYDVQGRLINRITSGNIDESTHKITMPIPYRSAYLGVCQIQSGENCYIKRFVNVR